MCLLIMVYIFNIPLYKFFHNVLIKNQSQNNICAVSKFTQDM